MKKAPKAKASVKAVVKVVQKAVTTLKEWRKLPQAETKCRPKNEKDSRIKVVVDAPDKTMTSPTIQEKIKKELIQRNKNSKGVIGCCCT